MSPRDRKLNGLTRQLEGLRAELGALEEAGVKANFAGGGVGGMPPRDANHAHEDNVMSREGVLVQTCKVENQIKDALDIMEKLLDREKKRLHRELERVRMEKFWNLADGLRRRNAELSPVELMWIDEETKLDGDVSKVRGLRNMCWQRMHIDAQKLEALRIEEQERQERQERRERQRQERKDRQRYESNGARQERTNAGYFTDTGAGAKQFYEPKPSNARPDPRKKASSEEEKILVAWRGYQVSWTTTMAGKSTPLTYANIPWPVACEPFFSSTLTPSRIAEFLLSPVHSTNKTPMERLRDAMKIWHPDKWEGKFMSRVVDSEQVIVREGLGMVARALIELMHVQKKLDHL